MSWREDARIHGREKTYESNEVAANTAVPVKEEALEELLIEDRLLAQLGAVGEAESEAGNGRETVSFARERQGGKRERTTYISKCE
jgi:hypothetical protein